MDKEFVLRCVSAHVALLQTAGSWSDDEDVCASCCFCSDDADTCFYSPNEAVFFYSPNEDVFFCSPVFLYGHNEDVVLAAVSVDGGFSFINPL
jgi:hypothetical protein